MMLSFVTNTIDSEDFWMHFKLLENILVFELLKSEGTGSYSALE